MKIEMRDKFLILCYQHFYMYLRSVPYFIEAIGYCTRDEDYVSFATYNKSKVLTISHDHQFNKFNVELVKRGRFFFSKETKVSLSNELLKFPEFSKTEMIVDEKNIEDIFLLTIEGIKKHFDTLIKDDLPSMAR